MLVAYLYLSISIVFEMVAASVVVQSKGWTVPKPTIICIVGYAFRYYLFGLCLSDIDLGVGYATWGAVGTIVTPIVGYFIYKQKLSKWGLFALILIIISTLTLNLFGW